LKSKRKIDKAINLAARKFFEALQTNKPPSPKLIEFMAFRAQQAAFAACKNKSFQEYNCHVGRQNGKAKDIEGSPGSPLEFMKFAKLLLKPILHCSR
jgi:hypothetical protein